MKRDGFGVEHKSTCREPQWRSTGGGQICVNCGTRWKFGDPTTSPQPRQWSKQ